jgi:hypothetical protein
MSDEKIIAELQNMAEDELEGAPKLVDTLSTSSLVDC